MIRIIAKSDEAGRADFMRRLSDRSVGIDSELLRTVSEIIEEVRKRGDAALIEYAARFDQVNLNASDLRVSSDTLQQSAAKVDRAVLAGLREAIRNVRAFHQRQCEKSWEQTDANQTLLGQRITPIESVGLYVPGGTAAYPSSVVMNVVPAKVAQVERIVVTTPPDTVRNNPAVAAALLELEVEEVYAVGGAQAIAALAFGTETIKSVDKITGPGNKYVAAAKKLVFGVVGIDSIAGPSEVVIVADESARADFIAADLLAQSEHGEDASAVLITTSETLAKDVVAEVVEQSSTLPRRAIVEESLSNYGAILVVADLTEACGIVNELAPEHLQLLTSDNNQFAQKIKHAGAIFLGEYSPEAVGDYFAGPNHVLPTGRTARFSSALGVYDFVKRTSLIGYSKAAMTAAADTIAALAEAEGLQAHARSALIRKL
ncbi:MAG TPA: histidinol dehydrogenase [Pyrinomonadaceae bacterium]